MRQLAAIWIGLAACADGEQVTPVDTGQVVIDCSDVDQDGDGSTACDDCDDRDASRYPAAPEQCNGIDDNCDNELGWAETDADADGIPDCQLCDEMGFWTFIDQSEPGRLADQLALAMENHECREYSEATDYMFVNLDKIDGEVECVYTGRTVAVGNDKPEGNDMNTEHTWPQSAGADMVPAKCDLNHLFPTDALANTKRGSHPFGEVTGTVEWSREGSILGTNSDGVMVFEPRDSHKGNVARALLYFEFRYAYRLEEQEVTSMLGDGRRELLAQWHTMDPPTERDKARSEQIGAYMGGGNPLVVCPGALELLMTEQAIGDE